MFHWDEASNASFQKIKDLIAKTASQPFRYYDRTKPVTVQADASQRGLGACLVQEGKPIAFTSKSLTDTETRYANIERELLAIVFACQHFNTYVLGRQFTVESDHKPLEMIHQKSLASAPPRLQRMLLQLQRYDLTIKYRPGKDMLLGDALSRCPSHGSEEIKLDMHVDYVAFNKAWIAKLKEATWEDPITGTVYQLTQQDWPHQRRHTPRMARVYQTHHLVTKLPPEQWFHRETNPDSEEAHGESQFNWEEFPRSHQATATPIAEGMPSPAEILHGRSLVTRRQFLLT